LILEKGQPWLSADKLRAVRLLGKQPFGAIDEPDVAMVFIAAYRLKGGNGSWDWEITAELADGDIKRFRHFAPARQLDSLRPKIPPVPGRRSWTLSSRPRRL
jgi:hypothetical protein